MPMEIAKETAPIRVSTVILQCEGALDRTSYQSLLQVVLTEIKLGVREIIIDLSKLERISLAGMVGLYLAGALLEGNDPLVAPLMEENDLSAVDGWEVIHRICEATEEGIIFSRVHLLVRSAEIRQCLESAGIHQIMRVMKSLDEVDAVGFN